MIIKNSLQDSSIQLTIVNLRKIDKKITSQYLKI